jgi:uncharacterized membrane protein
MSKKINYDKWTTEQLSKQIKTMRFATGLLGGILLVLLGVTIYRSLAEGQLHLMLIAAVALSAIIPLNIKRIRDIQAEINRRKKEEGS